MTNTGPTIDRLLRELHSNSELILSLDLDDESNDEIIQSIQDEQRAIRDKIDGIIREVSAFTFSSSQRSVLNDCYQLELQIKERLMPIYVQASNQLKIQQMSGKEKKARDTYSPYDAENTGYFFDLKR
ncbi:hypothetical protein [Cohnella terricola]|uniref:Flagellar protein FliT n=1 Tax=Cohnella terricola TaxID=1289167 RepID=A0A559J899_9BACL|nr:hypothetical protein [Cohnella terricola]TVX96102.1 hypothetical protein FPZ45_22005 [Cohnella terricola]